MSTEEEASRPPFTPGSGPDAGDQRRRRPREARGRREGGGSRREAEGDYKPSESAARREGASSGEGRTRAGSGGRRGGPRAGSERGRRGDKPTAPKKDAAPPMAKTPKPEKAPASFQEELGGELLAAVSRSFSLTIKVLPPALRAPITAGYLLARALDTIADTSVVPAEKRLDHLRALLEMIKYGPDPELLGPLQKDLAAKQSHAGEKLLIQKLARCLAWLGSLPAGDQWDLQRALSRIGRGQELDLLRFKDGTAAAPKPLADDGELDEYTYFVAGCVGELWTRLCERHLPAGWSRLPTDEMLRLSKRFGQGLQMTNVLRDLPEDLANGRCYLPETLLAAQGLTPETLLDEPARVRPILYQLRQETVEKLDDAWKYTRSLTGLKLRYACALPVLLGLETLGLLAKQSPLESSSRLKVSRGETRKLMLSSAVGTALSAWHDSQYKRARARAMGK